jgi:UDP-N-acetylglucosamine acyltransferase
MAYVHIAHDCIIGKNCIIANAANLAGHIKIHDYAIVGGMCAVHQFVNIGKYTMIGGGSLVRKDVPPFIKAAREPISFGGINSIGLRRRGFSMDKIKEIHNIYKILYLNGYNVSQALEIINSTVPSSPERDEIVQFIKSSTRGIIRGYCNKD